MSDPLWFKDAIIYELHVRAFADSNDDGIGDFKGLTSKLDYLQDLGVTALWLLPFYPSPLKDDGYDTARYSDVHPSYGTLDDFKEFLEEAHKRGLKVITELVLNHTSDQHEWFQKSRRAEPGSKWRNFYVWNDSPQLYKEARIIFKDFESSNWSWDPVANSYYWHRFYSHQPDLNWENPEVQTEMFRIVDFWFGLGVDGLRLDAVPYLFERDGTSCENLPETHEALRRLRKHVDDNFKDRMLLAEANQWPEDAVAYFGMEGAKATAPECHMAFHFPLMPRLFMAIGQEDRFPIMDIIEQTPAIPDTCQWALFLRNHDELTLEMVTDEDRDYMYRKFATDPQARINLGIRRRLAPLMGNDRATLRLLNGLLLSFSGTPVIYYGDEIGMGDNIYLGDRNGVRTPMQWSADRNAGFSRCNPQKLYLPIIIDPEYHYEAHNVEAQQASSSSFLWWMKRLISVRQEFKAFGRGSFEFLQPKNRKVLAFLRRHEDEVVLVVANLSRYSQAVQLDLSSMKNRVPVEIFGHTDFPPITNDRYTITLGPHDFLWFSLETRAAPDATQKLPDAIPSFSRESWLSLTAGDMNFELEAFFEAYLPTRRWFAGKANRFASVRLEDVIDLGEGSLIILLEVSYHDVASEVYSICLSAAFDEAAARAEKLPVVVARLAGPTLGLVYEGLWNEKVTRGLYSLIAGNARFSGALGGELRGIREPNLVDADIDSAKIRVMQMEQSNSAVFYGDRFFMKLFRRPQEGVQPEVEVAEILARQDKFTAFVPLFGYCEYHRPNREARVVSVLQANVPSSEDAWQYTQDSLGRFFDSALSGKNVLPEAHKPNTPIDQGAYARAFELIGPYLHDAELMGRRVAEMHIALSVIDSAFAHEPFTPHYQRSIYQSMRTQARQALQLLKDSPITLPEAEHVLKSENEIFERLASIFRKTIHASRGRSHGDLHLGQLLHTGKDFMIVDFEGEPSRSLSERRIKRSPLRDVASMLRSFAYAAMASIVGPKPVALRAQDVSAAETAARYWQSWVSAAFMHSYLLTAGEASFVPKNPGELRIMLDAYLIEKAMYELAYELSFRPQWVRIPLIGITDLLTPRA